MRMWSVLYTGLVFCLCWPHVTCGQNINRVHAPEVLTTLLFGYDHNVPPFADRDGICLVSVRLHFKSIKVHTEGELEFSAEVQLQQQWTDERLQFHGSRTPPKVDVDNVMMDRVWMPDTYFANARHKSLKDTATPNKLLQIYSNGSVVFKTRVTVTTACWTDINKFPMDRPVCTLIITSFRYTQSRLLFLWDSTPHDLHHLPQLLHFEVVDFAESDCQDSTNNDTSSCLRLDIYMQRRLRFYVLHVYVPTTLVLLVTWMSFWLHHKATGIRTSLNAVAALVISFQFMESTALLCKDVTALDMWVATCFIFVIFSIVEHAFVCATTWPRLQGNSLPDLSHALPIYDHSNCFLTSSPSSPRNRRGYFQSPHEELLSKTSCGDRDNNSESKRTEITDKISRIIFPLAFLVFAVIYWTYLSLSKHEKSNIVI